MTKSQSETDSTDEPGLILRAIDEAIEERWPEAKDRARAIDPGALDRQATQLSKAFARELGALGAAVGGAAAVPGVGTASVIAASAGELAINITRTTDLILSMGALHGHDQASVEERRAWVMSVLAFGSGASVGFTKIAGEVGIGLGKKATAAIPMTVLRRINRLLGRRAESARLRRPRRATKTSRNCWWTPAMAPGSLSRCR